MTSHFSNDCPTCALTWHLLLGLPVGVHQVLTLARGSCALRVACPSTLTLTPALTLSLHDPYPRTRHLRLHKVLTLSRGSCALRVACPEP